MSAPFPLLVLVLLLLGACAGNSGQEVKRQFYHLQPLALHNEGEVDLTLPLVLIKPASVAPLLQQQALVVLSEPQQVHLSQTHHWAEELDMAISRNLQLELQRLQANATQVFRTRTGLNLSETPALELQLDVDAFYAQGSKQQALNRGSFSLYRDKTLIYRQAYNISQTYQGREYHHLVMALQETQKRLAQLVSEALMAQLVGAGQLK